MPHIRLTINGDTVLNQHVSETQPAPPAGIQRYLDPTSKETPGMLELLSAFGRAVKAGKHLDANLETHPNGYTLTANYNQEPTPWHTAQNT